MAGNNSDWIPLSGPAATKLAMITSAAIAPAMPSIQASARSMCNAVDDRTNQSPKTIRLTEYDANLRLIH